MEQQNYFTYNIIDAIYFNQPTGDDLTKLYGVDNQFKRRNPTQYATLSQAEKDEYDIKEKRFIQGVINKYIIDDYGGRVKELDDQTTQIVMDGSYIGIDTEYHNQSTDVNQSDMVLTYTYLRSNKEKGIELSDMITNINGVHNYKLMSAKDIDFDNVILPNSAITREFNWGGFDINRRWGSKPIHINNTFELLNVIDYLLCACDNLWNELYKIKYSVNEGVTIWFTKNVSDLSLISSARQLVVQDFQKDSDRPDTTKMITYLNPTKYYTSLNNDIDNNFGIVTNFYMINEDIENLSFDRKIVDVSGKNIILMSILPQSKPITNDSHVATTSQNINGNLQQIYSYKIGDELKLYPGSRIDSFINERYIKILANDVVDFKNKKLKNETYFNSDPLNNIFSKVYIKFLNSSTLNLSNNLEDFENSYFLYYINNLNKKVIIAYSYQRSELSLVPVLREKIEAFISSLSSYEFFGFDNNALDDQVYKETIGGEVRYSPKLYIINDEFFSTLEVATPNSKKFSASSKSIMIYYYKNNNKLDCKITRLDEDGETPIEIISENDPIQTDSLTYNYFRYNVPDGQDITFKFDSTYIALDSTPEGNPLGLKLDDEYKDIMLYHPENVTTEEQASQYYELKSIETSGLYNRVFEQFDKDTFINNKDNYTSTDAKSNNYKHTWVKYDNPYQLNAVIDHDELINQTMTSSQVQDEISYMITWNELKLTSYNTYTLNHVLSGDIEEIKLDLRFQINETSKVKATECVIPLNINKIYSPTINYFSYQAVKLENSNYSDIKYTYYDSGEKYITLSDIYERSFLKYGNSSDKKGLDYIPNLCKIISNNNQDINQLEDLKLETTYNNVINNTCFEFTYNSTNNIVNLIGGWYTENYILRSKTKGFAATQLLYDNSVVPVILKSIGGDSDLNHLYVFNLNGFNKKYRLHGNSKTVQDNINRIEDVQLKGTIYNEFDLVSLASEKDHQSINEQLKIKLVDDAQLTYICVNKDEESSKEVWTENDSDFYSGINVRNKDYIIKTLPVDIYKTSYQVSCIQNYNVQDYNQSDKFTYYVPISYMYINSSTFYPPANTIPNGIVPDMNDPVEKTKYQQYMECWNETNHYHPITLSLKLFNNTTYSNPYYYDSNEAVMKFNIKRGEKPSNIITVKGIEQNWVFVSINSNYYLSDFIHIVPGENVTLNNMHPSGSYFYYDNNRQSYIVNEIYSNTINDALGSDHNKHYDNANVDLTQYASFNENIIPPETKANSFNGAIIPFPIFHQKIEKEDETVEFSNSLYDYDIYRLADINKLDITNVNCHKYKYNYDNASEDISSVIQGIYTNTTFYTIQFDEEFHQNFGDTIMENQNEYSTNSSFNILRYHIEYGDMKGSKNYNGATTPNSSTNTFICPIIRERIPSYYTNEHPHMPILYGITRDYKDKTYEFFEFRYENVYEVQKINNEWVCKSIAPGKDLSCQEAYTQQLILFLKNDHEDFISDLETYENYYEIHNG